MKDAGHITQEQYDEAMSDNVYARIKKVNNKLTKSDDQVYSYFVDEVVKQVLSDLLYLYSGLQCRIQRWFKDLYYSGF